MSVKQQRPVRRPKVAGHNRPRPAQPEQAPVEDVEEGEEVVEVQRPRWPLALVIAAAVLAGAGVFFLVKAQNVDSGVDTRAMTEVNGQVKAGLERIFSFSYDKIDATAARDVLAGQAVGEYDKLIEQVRAQAPAQKLVLATRVTTTGVKRIDGDRAELLVFLDQVATRADTGKTSGSAAALSVTAEKQDGVWKITQLTPR
ncbi:nuclear transport factor 2 family protein [Kibdelosporangium persicum]|uniref:Mce-associated membrane protein n=1 Tax=Kibdelosporangium persicum TaxID=2698649 RepID=A0ABX2EVG5_9PSEU|nr:nuclear transport factor 2 family protein [Kibdelosporangium persicum]NRN63025.1 Mce-associated membrane protein [Kibdelosporangium persicum]